MRTHRDNNNEENRDILLYGNVEYFSEQDIRYIAGKRQVAAAGSGVSEEQESHSEGRIRFYSKTTEEDDFEKLFQIYDFDTLIFASGYLTFEADPEEEIEDLRRLLSICIEHKISRGIILFPQYLCGNKQSPRKMKMTLLEALCQCYADQDFSVQVMRCPYLASGRVKGDYFRHVLDRLSRGEDIDFPYPEGEEVCLISQNDMNELLVRLLNRQPLASYEQMTVHPCGRNTFGELASLLAETYPDSTVRCSESGEGETFSYGKDELKESFGWQAKKNLPAITAEIEEEYRRNLPEEEKKTFFQKHPNGRKAVAVTELLAGAVLMDVLTKVLHSSVHFQMIDVRLLYVVLISSVYGLNMGTAASLLACVSLAAAFISRGITSVMLFYQPDNWLPFILFFTASSICGLVHDRHSEEKRMQDARIEELQKEAAYIDELYDEAVNYKREYKQNLIQSRDGFGRIYEVVQKLAVTEPTKIYEEAVSVMEDVLDSDAIGIYSINEKNTDFARLEVSSRRLTEHLPKSVRIADFQDVTRTLNAGKIWVNRRLEPGYPSYVGGVQSDGVLRVIICVYDADFSQMTSYYENLVRILCGLIQSFMLEAWSYQQAASAQNHIGSTSLVSEKLFNQELQIRRDQAAEGLASYCLIRIEGDGYTPEQMDSILKGKHRDNDLVTMDDKSHDYFILLLQTTRDSEQLVLNRFRKLGLRCSIAESRGGEE